MIAMMGGKDSFAQHLDSLFTMELPDRYFEHTEDISREGIMGNYVHGNEPSHHVPYLYNWTNAPWKTQARVREIIAAKYRPGPDGLSGNDDFGQMSAWYIFSALGFYPVAPGSVEYALGSPSVTEATINLENGNSFTIVAKNQSNENVYVQGVKLNGKKLTRPFITHSNIMAGGVLEFDMGHVPNTTLFSSN